jgi:UDP-N-acetylmuramoyl-tripeptide--D-alanyl-D-alanine ligase
VRLPDGGQLLLIDESYNANPASMAATLKSLGDERVEGRRIAVLGTMRELGEFSDEAHAGVAAPVLAAGVDPLILVGEETRPLEDALAGRIEVLRAADPEQAAETLLQTARAGDAVLVKASNGVGLARLVERVAGGAATCST